MNAREQARFDMLKRVSTFGSNNASALTTPVPPNPATTPGQNQAEQLFADLSTPKTGLIERIAGTAQTQQSGSGDFHGGTTSKTVLRDALLLELKGINRTAAAIAEAQNKPDIMDQFRMPYGVGDTILVAKANAIADAAEGMADDFIAHGHDATFAGDLRDHIDAFGAADSSRDTGQQTQAGATSGFTPLLAEAMTKVKQLDAFMQNFYKSNASKLGEWKTASHVERQSKAKKQQPPPAKPNA